MLPKNIAVVIMSRKRADSILKNSLPLFPYATVTVEESELDDYARVIPRKQLLPHPHFDTLAELRNWIDDSHEQEFVYQVHDDLSKLMCLVGWRPRSYSDPSVVAQVLERIAICARDAGCFLFGPGNLVSAPQYRKMRPFRLNGYVRNVIGFRKGHGLRWDPATLGHHDVDIGLQALLAHRIIWRDERWQFVDARLASNAGGLSGIRTEDWLARGRRELSKKWGSRYVHFAARRDWRTAEQATSTTEATVITVSRRDRSVGPADQ